jgi:hypothetical protein
MGSASHPTISIARGRCYPHARRHLVRVGSLKFGRLWAMRRRKDDGECCAMMGTATTTATTIYNDIYKNENTIYEDAPRVPLCLLSNKIARKCGV